MLALTFGRTFLLLAVLLSTACAARSGGARAADLARAEERVRDGCYQCLLEARDLYEAARSARQPVLARLLEVELLLVLREKELALETTERMARVTALAAELGPAANASRYVAIVDAVPPDGVGTPRVGRRPPPIVAVAGGRATYLAETIAVIRASGFTPAWRAYVELAVRCEIAREGEAPALSADAPGDAPLLRYRLAICGFPIDVAALEAVRTAVPEFTETSLFLGRAALATISGSDPSRVLGLFEDAYAHFPHSPAVTYHLAAVNQAAGDCRAADALFTETLALREQHEDARLGRTICRTYLANYDGAIADATVLIDTRADNRAEGHYWRAWNRRAQKTLDLARADIDAARALLYNARVLTLAGMIEHDQREFDKAREDLTRSRDMDPGECQARWYLGLVGYALEEWPEAAAGFADAADCYERVIRETEGQREAMARRVDLSEEYRRRQLAGFTAAIAEDRTQKSAADLNAAINYARAGDVERATVYMKRAAVDPERLPVVEDLRQVLGVPRW